MNNGAFTWGVAAFGEVAMDGLDECTARQSASNIGGSVVRVPYVYPNGEVAE